jgi:biopolymer transport protein ExbD
VKRVRGRFAVGPCEFQAASMADLGFLLLIFFIVTTVFAIEQGIPLVLPGRARAITRLKQADVLEIHARADGTVEAGGVLIRADDIRRVVGARLAHEPDLVIVLSTTPDASYGVMVHVLDQIKLANCRRISLRSLE